MSSKNPVENFEPVIEPFLGTKEQLSNRETVPIEVFDTTLRDGEQAQGSAMTMQQKIFLAKALARMGVDSIEAGFPSSNDDGENVKTIVHEMQDDYPDTEITGLTIATEKGVDATYEAVADAKNKRIHIFHATSPQHLKVKFGDKSEEQTLKDIERVVGYASQNYPDARIQFSPEDATRTEPRFLVQTVRAAILSGADKINIPDTNGVVGPDYIKWMFEQIMNNVEDLRKEFDVLFSFHGHNDTAVGVANANAAIQAGARQVEACLGPRGERVGNFPIEEWALHLDKNGMRMHPDYIFVHELKKKLIIPTVRAIYEIYGEQIPPRKVLVGSGATLHGAGVHTDGFQKGEGELGDESTYNIVNPFEYGGEVPERPVGSRAGGADVVGALKSAGIKVDLRSKKRFNDVLEEATAEAVRIREVFPAHVLYKTSKLREGLNNVEFNRVNGSLEVHFDFKGRHYNFEADVRDENSEIQALVDGISDFTDKEINVPVQDEKKQYSDEEVEYNYRKRTGLPVDGFSKGAEAEGISHVVISDGDRDFNVKLASHSVSEANLKSIFIGAWPFIREKVLQDLGINPKEMPGAA